MREIVTILLVLFSVTVFATEQTPDVLIYKSDTIFIETYPFENLMNSDSLIRKRIFGDSDEYCISSGCWRGHVATWIIENDSLFLIDLIDGCEENKFILQDVFNKEKVINNKVFADWFTGDLLEYESWFVLIDDDDSKKKPDRFSCKIINGKVKFINYNKLSTPNVNSASDKSIEKTDTTVYIIVDENPVLLTEARNYEMSELKYFIVENIKFPQNEIDCMGSVYISFIVEKNGNVSNKKFERKLCEGYDEEAMKVIDLMTNWKPGLLKGIPVRTKITLPIRYLYE